MSAQPDLFRADTPDENWQPQKFGGEPERVRRHLRMILEIVRNMERLSTADTRMYGTIFPQMVKWLPEDEAAEFLRAFDAEVRRLEAA